MEEIGDYLRDRNPSAAVRVLDELVGVFKTLALNPEIGTRREDLHAGLRMYIAPKPAMNYVIFYSMIQDGVLITDVIHAARNWMNMFFTGER